MYSRSQGMELCTGWMAREYNRCYNILSQLHTIPQEGRLPPPFWSFHPAFSREVQLWAEKIEWEIRSVDLSNWLTNSIKLCFFLQQPPGRFTNKCKIL
mmetsp:Transcript_42056/g.85854  ORF Transcript_42056/g.85854 Transcript_42056/m.85854 type:complete len:98 (+) Transcript_42056:351-644(+)